MPEKHIIIFDVMVAPETYLTPMAKHNECVRIGLECVPLLFSGMATNLESISTLIAATSVLGGVPMEGAVIKKAAKDKTGKDYTCSRRTRRLPSPSS